MLPIAQFFPTHSLLTLDVDPFGGNVAGKIRLSGMYLVHGSDPTLRLNFRGGIVHSVTVLDMPASFQLLDPLGAAASLSPSSGGLETLHAALSAACCEARLGELRIALPPAALVGAPAGGRVFLSLDIIYSLPGAHGALAVVPVPVQQGVPAHNYVFTKQRPGLGSELPALGAGPRTLMPCIDALDSRCTFEMALTLTGADEEGVLPGGLLVDVLGCGDFVRSESVEIPRHPARREQHKEGAGMAVEGGASSSSSRGSLEGAGRAQKRGRGYSMGGEDVVEALLGPSSHTRRRTKSWVFRINVPVPPSALGWVVGPLSTVSRKVISLGGGGGGGGGSGGSALGSHEGGGGGGTSVGEKTPGARGSFGKTPGLGGYHSNLVTGGISTGMHTGMGGTFSGGQHTQSMVGGGGGAGQGFGTSTRVSYHASPSVASSGIASVHIHRTRRMLSWFCEWLDCAYPFNAHRFVFLPLGAAPCLGPAAAISVCAGLTILPDAMLHSARLVDCEAGTHAVLAEGLASVWLGVLLSPASWRDAWLLKGLAGYATAAYLASFRGGGEAELARARIAETVAGIEASWVDANAAPEVGGARHQCQPYASYPLCPPPSSSAFFPFHAPMLLGMERDSFVALKAPLAIHALAQCVGEHRFRMGVGSLVARVLCGEVGGALGGGAPVAGSATSAAAATAAPPAPASAPAPCTSTDAYAAAAASTKAAKASLRKALDALTPNISTELFLELLALLSAAWGSSSSGASSREAIMDVAQMWVYGSRSPRLHVRLAYSKGSNQISAVVEQWVPPGCRIGAKGPLRLYVLEVGGGEDKEGGGGGMPGSAPLTDTFAHTLRLSGALKQTFELKVHTKVKGSGHTALTTAAAAFLKKKAAGKSGGVRLAGSGGEASALDDWAKVSGGMGSFTDAALDAANESPVLGVYADPEDMWLLAPMHIFAPPMWSTFVLSHHPSPGIQLKALKSLCNTQGALLARERLQVDDAPNLGDAGPSMFSPLYCGGVAPLTETQQSTVGSFLSLGFVLRPTYPLTPLFRCCAVFLGINPLQLSTPSRPFSGDAYAPAPPALPPLTGSAPLPPSPLPFSWRIQAAAAWGAVRALPLVANASGESSGGGGGGNPPQP